MRANLNLSSIYHLSVFNLLLCTWDVATRSVPSQMGHEKGRTWGMLLMTGANVATRGWWKAWQLT